MSKIEDVVAALESKYAAAQASYKKERQAGKAVSGHIKNIQQAQAIILQVAQRIQHHAHASISSLVTRCLRTIYHDDRQFKLVFERKAGKTWARPVLVKNGHEERPRPGGEADVICFGLRIACLLLSCPRPRRLLVLDEPFKHLNGAVYQSRVRSLLEMMAEELKIQFIIATDDDWLRLGKVVQL